MTNPVFAGYDAKRDQLQAWLRRHYAEEFGITPGRLLDAGCGNGFWSDLWAEEGHTVTGIDHRPEYVAEARSRYPEVKFHKVDLDFALPRYITRYDVVFARCLPYFYAPDVARVSLLVANLMPHVSPGGLLLLSAYTDGSGEERPLLVGGTATHHRVDDLLGAVGAEIEHTARVGNYLQVGVRA